MLGRMNGKLAVLAIVGLTGAGCSKLEGRIAPDFTLDSLEGRSVSPASQRGSVVLLSFWAVG